jgi:predicted O-methyltransferase YrrM
MVVEIGAWTGQSTCIIASYVKDRRGKFYTIDNFRGSPDSLQCLYNYEVKDTLIGNLKRFKVERVVKILDGNSDDFVSKFKDESIDLIFVDADHRYSQFTKDFKNWYPKVKIGGIFCGHDFNGTGYKEEYIERDAVEGIHHGISKAISEYTKMGLDMKGFKDSSIWWLQKTKAEITGATLSPQSQQNPAIVGGKEGRDEQSNWKKTSIGNTGDSESTRREERFETVNQGC